MKNPELFHETISILVKAYFEGMVKHHSYGACAVGNIIAAKMGKPPFFVGEWFYGVIGPEEVIIPEEREEGVMQILLTGYTIGEIAMIEHAFEKEENEDAFCDKGKEIDPDGFKGLMSVVDALQEIHQCTDKERDEAKAQFVK